MVAYGKNEEESASQAAAPAVVSAPAAATGGETVIKTGHATPLTGSAAYLDKDNGNGARLAIEEVNKKDLTIDGKKIKPGLVGEDGASDPKADTAVAQKLVDEHVVAVVGHLSSDVSIPVSKIYSDVGIIQISPPSTNPDYTRQDFRVTYRMVATDAQQGSVLANHAAKTLGAKTVVIVGDTTAYDKNLADELEKTARADSVNVVVHEATNDKATNFGIILTKVKDEKLDMIMYGDMDATGDPFVKQAKELSTTAKIVGGDDACTDRVAELTGDAIDNIVCSEAGLTLSKMGKGTDLEKKCQTRFDMPVQICASFTYDVVNVIIDAMKRANSTDPAKVLAAMPATNYNGVIDNVAFDDKGDLRRGSIILYNYKDEKKNVLDVVKM